MTVPLDTTDDDHRRRTLLVGTSLSVKQLHHVLGQVKPKPVVVGCLVKTQTTGNTKCGPIPVLGQFVDLDRVIEREQVEQVLISLPVTMRDQTQKLARTLDQSGTVWRWIPTLADQLAGRLRPAASADVQIDMSSLINRQPRPLDEEAIRNTLAGRRVLITGAGGSIGSELARLVSRFEPSKLVLLDRSENALFEIDRDIARMFPDLESDAILHDVTDAPRTLGIVSDQKPEVIFHAAAHKHVPMMEDHPTQAVENNFFGTRSIADAADRVGAGRFVMISTDKAVNPSSVMGATKRLAELYIQHLNTRSSGVFSMVRFGNVLGSACSVIPIWRQQLARGEPITVTHRDMHRYFMTIPEAAGLVLQSAALAGNRSGGGEVFLLNMDRPVRILDLAYRFVRWHGLEPELDIPIKITGPRPGEKLFEELAYDSEDMIPTPHESVRIWRTVAPDAARIEQMIAAFDRLRAKGRQAGGEGHFWQHATRDTIIAALRAAVPEMVKSAAG